MLNRLRMNAVHFRNDLIRLVIGVLLLSVLSCNSAESKPLEDENHTLIQTHQRLQSKDYFDTSERISILKGQIRAYSEVLDVEFDLFNVNGFDTNNTRVAVPGASSWDYKFAIKVTPTELGLWLEGLEELAEAPENFGWTTLLVEHQSSDWETSGTPRYYKRKFSDVLLEVYPKEGIIFKRFRRL